jgi:hypothetical protein
MNILKKIGPDVAAIIFFIVLSFAYLFPACFEGRVLTGSDSAAGVGAGREIREYYLQTGESSRWTNALFGGMPTYQSAPSYPATNLLSDVGNIYHLFLPTYVWYLFVMLLGFYILMRAFNFKSWMSALGAVLWTFSSYFFIIIAAGHIWKLWTLAYIPPTIAGMVLCYRKKYLWGAAVTALFVAFQISANHVQMTYYFLFPMFFMFLAYLAQAIKNKELPAFAKGTAALLLGAIIGVCVNLSNLYHTWEYSKETMRGKSELVSTTNPSNQTDGGLDRDYITQWSYGIGETFSLMVPNVKGGASVPLALNPKAMEKADPMYTPLYNQLGQYWGEQPGTSGPVYVGAFVCLLFVLALFLVKGPMKWALLLSTLLSFLLSWGKNLQGFTDLFIDYMPMYAKFRAVSSILVIAEFTIPLLAILGLNEWLKAVKAGTLKDKTLAYGKVSPLTALYISFIVTGGLCLLFAVAPTLFFSDYVSTSEMEALQNANLGEHFLPILNNLKQMRIAIFTADAWRSFGVILIGTLILLLGNMKKWASQTVTVLLLALCLVDMWSVNKRYLYDDLFEFKINSNDDYFRQLGSRIQPTVADEAILQDKSLDYRVLNFSTNTFNENNTSYFHKSIGGYHAAKLRRYQEMIEHHIAPEMTAFATELRATQGDVTKLNGGVTPVLNMLNTKYFIFGPESYIENPHAYGNAWFVNKVQYVQNANEEIDALNAVSPRTTAIVDKKFETVIKNAGTPDSTDVIRLDKYLPNALKYTVESKRGGVVVFSEIYYPGWVSTIDGQPVEHGRADYILRAMNVPAGKHTIEFRFDPQSLHVTDNISYAALALLALLFIGSLVVEYRKKKND